MKTFKFLFLVSSLAVAGGGGYVAGTRGLATNFDQLFSGRALGETVPPAPMPTGKVIYYRHPDGTPEYSATPRETPDGRAFVAVRQSEDVSFEPVKPASEEAQAAPATGERKILYYRNPMGLPDTSKVPKKDSMGMDYIPVYEGNEADGSVVKVSLGKLQRTGVKTATAERTVVARKVRVPGTIAFDERLVRIVSMRADAFIEGVADVTTGDRVRKGAASSISIRRRSPKPERNTPPSCAPAASRASTSAARCNCAISVYRKRRSGQWQRTGRYQRASPTSRRATASSSNATRPPA